MTSELWQTYSYLSLPPFLAYLSYCFFHWEWWLLSLITLTALIMYLVSIWPKKKLQGTQCHY